MRRHTLLAIVLLAATCEPVYAAEPDRALCQTGGPTPPFATRSPEGCWLVPTGHGDAVPFQYLRADQKGLAVTARDSGETLAAGLDWIDLYNCPRGVCSFLGWRLQIDNYLSAASKNDDVLFFGTGQRNKYTLIKDSIIANGVKCDGGTGWTGPNGLRCAAGEKSGAHSDGAQLRGQPVDDGWFVLQDTVFVNGYNLQLLVQGSAELGRTGSFVMQGGEIGRRPNVGAAANWVADCERRRNQGETNGSDICPMGRATIGSPEREVWLIDVPGETPVNANGGHQKIVVVNSGCDATGCAGRVGYRRGWPHPLYGWATEGPGRCPNGSIGTYQGSPAYCYESLERARADHRLPPFVQLSATGWATPPDGTPPPPPDPDPDPEPDPEPPPPAPAYRLVDAAGVAIDGTTVAGELAARLEPETGGVTRVDFLVDDVVQRTETSAPYSLGGDDGPGKLRTVTLGPGGHEIEAVVHRGEADELVLLRAVVTVPGAEPEPDPEPFPTPEQCACWDTDGNGELTSGDILSGPVRAFALGECRR